MNRLARLISEKVCVKLGKSEEEKEIVTYGLELILENLVKAIGFVILGMLTGTLVETLIIFLSFCPLRAYAGGIHMKTSAGCFLMTAAIWGISLVIGKCFEWQGCPLAVILVGMTGCMVIIWKYAPCDTSNNPITDPVIRKRKKHAAAAILILLAILCLLLRESKTVFLILVPTVLECLSLLPAAIKKLAGSR